ncbi:MAG: hypothetical protein IPO67_07730, partial [Deltaproteobacteria bacterium]|nr:hypothetical protein [Deltaproteobacteria bacterium]
AEGLWVGFVSDRLADHGLVAVGLVRDGEVVAFACSCRVLPHRVAGALLGELLSQHPGAGGLLTDGPQRRQRRAFGGGPRTAAAVGYAR